LNVHILDTRQLGRDGIIAVTALETGDGLVLFDTGPESTFENVVTDLKKFGASLADVRHIFVSHIHFDHAGAAWRFATEAQGSDAGPMIYVHPRGAPHLLDPEKLVRSATRIFGEDMQQLWGTVAPVPQDRLRVLEDNETVRVGSCEIRAIATPGHASHHHIYQWDDNIFGGDVAGVRIGPGPPIPPFVPPELHIESWLDSIAKMREIAPANLYLPHFGRVQSSIQEHLAELEERVVRWSAWYRDRLREGVNEEELVSGFPALEHAELRGGGATDDDIAAYETADPSSMAIPAAVRYWQKFHPDQICGVSG
jgi:glyoxylase-like metal-dependent hydrolase (beta-lactamase superfamily II)